MLAQPLSTLDHANTHDNGDALARLKRLVPSLDEANPAALSQVLPGLSATVTQVLHEHQGMAEELVFVYEQLGIIFEVTKKLAGVDDEAQVLRLFAESLSRSFQRRTIHSVRVARGGDWTPSESPLSLTPELRAHLDGVRTRQRVAVVEANEVQSETMIAPIFCGDELAAALILVSKPGAAIFKASEMLLVESLSTFCGDMIRSHRLVRELREMSVSMVRSLVSAVDQKDEYTCGHSLRVAHYATALGRTMGWSAGDLQMLQWGALLHDVGKIGIRDNVLKKEGKLTDEEFAHIKEHPVRSHKVVQQVPQLARALDGILHHHERFDGTGYPAGLRGEDIPLQARIIQIADVFDALTSNRSYRSAFAWEKALSIMAEEAGRTIDPKLQQRFDSWVRKQVGPDGSGWEALAATAGRIEDELTSTVDSC